MPSLLSWFVMELSLICAKFRWLASETRIWRAVLYGLGGGALVGAVLASILAGYEQRLLPMPWHLLLFGFLGFAFVSAGDGILTLLSKLMRTVFRGLRWERPEHLLQAIPQTPIGQLLAVRNVSSTLKLSMRLN